MAKPINKIELPACSTLRCLSVPRQLGAADIFLVGSVNTLYRAMGANGSLPELVRSALETRSTLLRLQLAGVRCSNFVAVRLCG